MSYFSEITPVIPLRLQFTTYDASKPSPFDWLAVEIIQSIVEQLLTARDVPVSMRNLYRFGRTCKNMKKIVEGCLRLGRIQATCLAGGSELNPAVPL